MIEAFRSKLLAAVRSRDSLDSFNNLFMWSSNRREDIEILGITLLSFQGRLLIVRPLESSGLC